MTKERILVAMSGGVDSSVAALLLKEQGYDCVGAMMQLFSSTELSHGKERELAAIESGANIAKQLNIPFEVCDLSAEFQKNVIDYFVQTYLDGATPNPCVECNRTMKFGMLYDTARRLGCEKIATGHYARITKDASGRYLLSAAEDDAKDQTYVLWSLSQEQLAKTLFPLGELRKEEIRALASEHGFRNANQKDSQDICFIPDGDYLAFIERYTQKSFPCGNFTDLDGNVIGRHQGHLRYTVGQRKGLGIAFGKPTYVCKKDAKSNTVTLGDDRDLFSSELSANKINLIATDRLDRPIRALVKVRYKAKPAAATVTQTAEDRIKIIFDEPQRAISPGQSAVMYDGTLVIGGGIIL